MLKEKQMDKLNQFLNETTEALKSKDGMTDWIAKYSNSCIRCGEITSHNWIAFQSYSEGLVCVDCGEQGEEL